MQSAGASSSTNYLQQRYSSLVWSCLEADLHRSAVFYAERYFVSDLSNHDARHLYATALLQAGQPHAALHLVDLPPDARCTGCLEVKSRCCTTLGRHRQARQALELCLQDSGYIPTPSMFHRSARAFPEQAALHCHAAAAASKGNQLDIAAKSYRQSLSLNPMIWEAFEGLCYLGEDMEVDDIFPPRLMPMRAKSEGASDIPMATGAGFFTPVGGGGGNLSNMWKHEPGFPRMGPPAAPRDSLASTESSFFPDDSFNIGLRPSRSQPATSLAVQPPAVRPLSSADETGPVAKKPRSGRQRNAPPSSTTSDNTNARPSKSAGALSQGAEELSKSSKARSRPVLTVANIFSSPGRRAQRAATSSRSNTAGASKAAREQQPAVPAITRRSSRLLSGNKDKQAAGPKATGRRKVMRTRSHSDSDMDEDVPPSERPTSPVPRPPSPSDQSILAAEQAAQEAYEIAMADYEIYNLTRIFASATRALATYDCRTCLDELEKLPARHQRSAWVMAMVGKAHFELGEYAAAQRAFEAVRNLEPYRLWDMEVFSTLLWHLQRSVPLSFLAQELLSINPRSPQAWIAVGNCFSLQKEKTQALTCFRRAFQLDPSCAYAYTLSGHELIDEDFDKAINFFQSALRVDPRHYNAWYGLGTCYMRMSKLRLADYHFRKAAEIHPNNAILLGCVGMVHERTGNLEDALRLFNEAIQLSPDNALVRYHRAKVLISLRRYSLAIQDLEQLRSSSPDESNVVFQLARVYRLTGDKVKAAQLLAVARDVSPKAINKIRRLLETMPDTDGGDDSVMDEG
ncbi:protein prenylyltransferase [Panus rudis PR-1116 ss-1]|nr:protein prenylyltransferase [Panus rudis PR-1116 ss-1]